MQMLARRGDAVSGGPDFLRSGGDSDGGDSSDATLVITRFRRSINEILHYEDHFFAIFLGPVGDLN